MAGGTVFTTKAGQSSTGKGETDEFPPMKIFEGLELRTVEDESLLGGTRHDPGKRNSAVLTGDDVEDATFPPYSCREDADVDEALDNGNGNSKGSTTEDMEDSISYFYSEGEGEEAIDHGSGNDEVPTTDDMGHAISYLYSGVEEGGSLDHENDEYEREGPDESATSRCSLTLDFEKVNAEKTNSFREIRERGMPQCLKWLQWKANNGVTERAMVSAMKLTGQSVSHYQMKKKLEDSGLRLQAVDACIKGHVAFSDPFREHRYCPFERCGEVRYDKVEGNAREKFEYFSLEEFVKAWLQSEDFFELMKYRHRETQRRRRMHEMGEVDEWITDYLDGSLYRKLDAELNFGENDICFQLTFDGYQLFKNSSHEAWPFVLLNLNLPPSERFKIENMIPYGITSGPKSPTDLISFLDPLIQCFEKYSVHRAMRLWDGRLAQVRLFLVLVTADTPAMSKIIHSRGHNAISPCRFCTIKGILGGGNHYYYPSSLQSAAAKMKRRTVYFKPERISEKRRDHEKLLRALEKIEKLEEGQERSNISREIGFKRVPELVVRLSSLKLFESFPLDIMHILYINIPKYMWKLWSGRLEPKYSKDDFVLEAPATIGEDMEASGGLIPVSFGRKPRNIAHLAGSFKAAEWKTFILHLSIPLLEERLPVLYLKGWKDYVAICSIVSRSILRMNHLERLQRLVVQFYKHFEESYFRFDSERLSLMKYVFHAILHLPECVKSCGPICNVDQFKAERFVGYLHSLLQSKFRPVRNLTRNLLASESLKLIRKIAGSSSLEMEEACTQRGFSLDGKIFPKYRDYSLLSPSGSRKLNSNERQLLRTMLRKERCSEELVSSIDSNFSCHVYGRLQINTEGITEVFGARDFLRSRGVSARWNCFVRSLFEDEGRTSSWYGVVERYYHVKLARDSSYLVACIRWADQTYLSQFGQIYARSSTVFRKLSIESVTCLTCTSLIGLLERKDLRRTYFISQA